MDQMQDLAARIAHYQPHSGMLETQVPGLSLYRVHEPSSPTPTVYEASLCLIAQGAKTVSLGETRVSYDPSRYLLVSMDLPLVGEIITASPEQPYLCCKIDLDQAMLADLVTQDGCATADVDVSPLAVCPSDPLFVDAACRLVGLLDEPDAINVLSPLIHREIIFRLLRGPHGPTLRRISTGDSRRGKIARAISRIRASYREPLRVEEIASAANMSPSSLHEHFKSLTTLTPLAYQKQLRLQEAGRLMLSDGVNAGTASFAVGYQSPSQFSRDYLRLFGAPPRQDVANFQKSGAVPD